MGIKVKNRRKIVFGEFNETEIGATCLSFLIDLEKTVDALGNALYEPEYFPGIIYLTQRPKSKIMLFGSGKLV